MRTLFCFLAVIALAISVSLILGVTFGSDKSWQSISVQLTAYYGPAIVLGLPTLYLLIAMRWTTIYHYLGVGVLIGLVPYLVVWDVLPVFAAYRDGRLDVHDALEALLGLPDNLPAGELSIVLGAISGAALWRLLSAPKSE